MRAGCSPRRRGTIVFEARVGYPAQRRAEGSAAGACGTLGWKAQLRLTGRFARLHARGMHKNKICVAMAREVAGFIWAIGTQSKVTPM